MQLSCVCFLLLDLMIVYGVLVVLVWKNIVCLVVVQLFYLFRDLMLMGDSFQCLSGLLWCEMKCCSCFLWFIENQYLNSRMLLLVSMCFSFGVWCMNFRYCSGEQKFMICLMLVWLYQEWLKKIILLVVGRCWMQCWKYYWFCFWEDGFFKVMICVLCGFRCFMKCLMVLFLLVVLWFLNRIIMCWLVFFIQFCILSSLICRLCLVFLYLLWCICV